MFKELTSWEFDHAAMSIYAVQIGLHSFGGLVRVRVDLGNEEYDWSTLYEMLEENLLFLLILLNID